MWRVINASRLQVRGAARGLTGRVLVGADLFLGQLDRLSGHGRAHAYLSRCDATPRRGRTRRTASQTSQSGPVQDVEYDVLKKVLVWIINFPGVMPVYPIGSLELCQVGYLAQLTL